MAIINSTVILADDLTGANDTALQYFMNNLRVRIVIDCSKDFGDVDEVDVWAASTESRNISKEDSVDRIVWIVNRIKEHIGVDNYYKKIDSTLRGNVGVEVVTLMEMLSFDAVVISPAYVEEGRTTIGSYQLLNGIPIERTQCALDPKAPIYESYIPDIISRDLNEKFVELIDTIDFKTVTKGAGPITCKLNELIQKGKKIIIADAISNTDLEQIALAINKSNYNILPVGSAGLANAYNKGKPVEAKNVEYTLPKASRLIVSGSATKMSAVQIQKLKEEKENAFFVDLHVKDIFTEIDEGLVNLIVEKLNSNVDVAVHCSEIQKEIDSEETNNMLIDAGIAKHDFASKITDYLANLIEKINSKSNFILISIGGETSYKCLDKINSAYLEILDAIMPSIPLCKDKNGKIIVTKSGNFGTTNTLVDILNYFDRSKNV